MTDAYDPTTAVHHAFNSWHGMPVGFRSYDALISHLVTLLPPALPAPLYPHTCNSCVYLGQYLISDLYVCRVFDSIKLLVRFSEEEYDFIETDNINSNPSIAVAFDRASQRRLIHRSEVTVE